MGPNFIIAGLLMAFAGGGLFYSYSQGVVKGENVCIAEKLAAQLEKTQKELIISKGLSELQKDQVSEAQKLAEELKDESDKLRNEIISIKLSPGAECVPNSVLDAIRKFRQGGKGIYTGPPPQR